MYALSDIYKPHTILMFFSMIARDSYADFILICYTVARARALESTQPELWISKRQTGTGDTSPAMSSGSPLDRSRPAARTESGVPIALVWRTPSVCLSVCLYVCLSVCMSV